MNFAKSNSYLLYIERTARLATVVIAISISLPIAFAQEGTSRADTNQTQTIGTSVREVPNAPSPALKSRTDDDLSVLPVPNPPRNESAESAPVSLAGVRATLSLVSEVSSKLPTGSSFQARLEEPVAKDGETVLPKGTVFEGRLKTIPARRPMRAGSVFMMFDRAILPGGQAETVAANLMGTNSESVKTDPEGKMRPTVSKKRLVIQLGGTALTAKLADDLSQVIGGTAVSAGTARYVGFGAATTFFLIQKGREVKLKPGDELEVEFGR
jgi:hypothetical protein